MSSKKKIHITPDPKPTTTVSSSVGNYEKHPFFVKKVAAAKAVLNKVGLPKQLNKQVHN